MIVRIMRLMTSILFTVAMFVIIRYDSGESDGTEKRENRDSKSDSNHC